VYASSSLRGEDPNPVFPLNHKERVCLLNGKLSGYLQNPSKSVLLSETWSEYCSQNQLPDIRMEPRRRGWLAVSYTQPDSWDTETRIRFQEDSIMGAAQAILGYGECLSPTTGELCDADTLAEVLEFLGMLNGYEVPSSNSWTTQSALLPCDCDQQTTAVSNSLHFICPEKEMAYAVADSLVQTAQEIIHTLVD